MDSRLAHLGVTSVEGLELVAETWRGFEPKPHTSREELHSLTGKMLLEMGARGIREPQAAERSWVNYLYQWPFPLWSLAQPGGNHNERKQQLHDIRQEQEVELRRVREVERVRAPAIVISEAKVTELHNAYVTYAEDRRNHEATFADDKPGGLRVIPASIPGYEEQSASYQILKGLWRELSEGERVSLAALAIFTRGQVADWAGSYDRAEWIATNNDERYQIHLGNAWLEGLRSYRADPPKRD